MNPKVPDYGEDFPVMTQFTNISEGGEAWWCGRTLHGIPLKC